MATKSSLLAIAITLIFTKLDLVNAAHALFRIPTSKSTGGFIMKKLLTTILMASASLATGSVLAADYPNKPIKLIVPYSAGGVTDLAGRALAEEMAEHLGESVVVDNKTGANGTMGAIQMLNTKPDGYTISMVPIGIYRMPHITETPYDPASDFTYISQVAG